ncbi:MAG: DUF192 domain-containing protein [bacterium]|nr:DUF192 domain-containing protein [bacterium]
MRIMVKAIVAIVVTLMATGAYAYIARKIGDESRDMSQRANPVFAERAVVRIPDAKFLARVEVARSPADRELGLSGRKALPKGAGMLFIFDQLDYHGIWMPKMRFSIDVIWIASGAVVDVTESLPAPKPGETYLPIFRPSTPALLVLEVPAGTVAKQGVRKGQRVEIAFDGG